MLRAEPASSWLEPNPDALLTRISIPPSASAAAPSICSAVRCSVSARLGVSKWAASNGGIQRSISRRTTASNNSSLPRNR